MSDAPLDWDEFRLVRAIAEAHSLAGAAERMGLNHSTLFRRLAALESRLGAKLFDRERSGYRPTAAGEDMVALANLMGDTIAEFERRVVQNDMRLSGRVRVATFHSLGVLVLPEICAGLREAYPGLHVELMLTEASPDLERGEADMALRALRDVPREGLTGRRIAPMRWAIYATARAGEGAPSAFVAPSEGCGPPQARQWVERNVEASRIAATASNVMAMAELAACGVGAALLPCFVAATKPELHQVGRADIELDGELWLLSTQWGLRTHRVRAAFDSLGEALTSQRLRFEG